MRNNYQKLIKLLGERRVILDEPLSGHTYFKIGGPAELYFQANSSAELKKAVKLAIDLKIDYLVLGGGSNILVGDKGIKGLVIKNRADKIITRKVKGKIKNKKVNIEEAEVFSESGVITNLLVRRTIQEGLAGLECFLGIPGTIGGAIYNNSHFKKELIGSYVDNVIVLDKYGNEKTYTNEQMKFGYDYSIIQNTKEIILNAIFKLSAGDPSELWQRAEEYAKKRTKSQPLNIANSGCIFKNLKTENCAHLSEKDKCKSAGYLIDKAGLKGKKIGGAMVSPLHANFIINTGNATAVDVLKLISLIKSKVKNKFGVQLEMEVFTIGEF